MSEIEIRSSDQSVIEHFREFRDTHRAGADLQEIDGFVGGLEQVTLIIQEIPEILEAAAMLVAVLKAKNIDFGIFKNNNELEDLEKV